MQITREIELEIEIADDNPKFCGSGCYYACFKEDYDLDPFVLCDLFKEETELLVKPNRKGYPVRRHLRCSRCMDAFPIEEEDKEPPITYSELQGLYASFRKSILKLGKHYSYPPDDIKEILDMMTPDRVLDNPDTAAMLQLVEWSVLGTTELSEAHKDAEHAYRRMDDYTTELGQYILKRNNPDADNE